MICQRYGGKFLKNLSCKISVLLNALKFLFGLVFCVKIKIVRVLFRCQSISKCTCLCFVLYVLLRVSIDITLVTSLNLPPCEGSVHIKGFSRKTRLLAVETEANGDSRSI